MNLVASSTRATCAVELSVALDSLEKKVIAESKKESVNLQTYLVDQHAIMARSLTVQVERYVDEVLEKERAEE